MCRGCCDVDPRRPGRGRHQGRDPRLGDYAEEILTKLGYSAAKIAALRSDGILVNESDGISYRVWSRLAAVSAVDTRRMVVPPVGILYNCPALGGGE